MRCEPRENRKPFSWAEKTIKETHTSSTVLPIRLSPSLTERTPLVSPFFLLSLAKARRSSGCQDLAGLGAAAGARGDGAYDGGSHGGGELAVEDELAEEDVAKGSSRRRTSSRRRIQRSSQ